VVSPPPNDHGLLTWEPAIGRQIQGAPLALRHTLQRESSVFLSPSASPGLIEHVYAYRAARYFSFSHSVTWTRYSSHSDRFSFT
jgi:hypothetical protein